MAASIQSTKGSIQPEYVYKKQDEANTTYVVGVTIFPKDGDQFQAEYQAKHVRTEAGMFWNVSNHNEARNYPAKVKTYPAKVKTFPYETKDYSIGDKGEDIPSKFDVCESHSSSVKTFFKGLINKLKVWLDEFRDDFNGDGFESTDHWSRTMQNYYRDHSGEIENMKKLVAVETEAVPEQVVEGMHYIYQDQMLLQIPCEAGKVIE
ncbi:hypothetical protein JQC92_04490 [Shewanella sp. 202IG2-18]|uniref:hypothetical protein n=1 Tax=Parashewanella hymeniacidonis TaxID=2807618 RepID=UPI0019605763|nr:hypothetical protein [Parashewanella hymeniacidonis]MBM7071300.1 hypothetical protein [Parashewanella hymeniacidonis]